MSASPANKLRVLVVEDSLTVRRRMVAALASDAGLEVVAEVGDGRGALELCRTLRPDVITLDMMLPGMNGLEATEQIMAHCPTPILIVSVSTNRGELFRTYEALAAGALDVLEKPRGDESDGAWESSLRESVKLIARIKVITHPRGRRTGRRAAAVEPGKDSFPLRSRRLVALGASTGGPGALVEILQGLPADFPAPILVVIHIGRAFASAFAEWLDGRSPLRVSFAQDGEPLSGPGGARVILAPADRHLVLHDGRLALTSDPERHSCRPSVDALFESIARDGVAADCVAGLLTGMGADGAQGLLALRRAGALTLAQDEASSVVFGMPRQAVALGAADQVLPLARIAGTIAALCERPAAGRPA